MLFLKWDNQKHCSRHNSIMFTISRFFSQNMAFQDSSTWIEPILVDIFEQRSDCVSTFLQEKHCLLSSQKLQSNDWICLRFSSIFNLLNICVLQAYFISSCRSKQIRKAKVFAINGRTYFFEEMACLSSGRVEFKTSTYVQTEIARSHFPKIKNRAIFPL